MKVTVKAGGDQAFLKHHYVYQTVRASRGWYQQRGFLILPELIPETHSLVLPRSSWLINHGWLDFQSFDHHADMSVLQKIEYDWERVDLIDVTHPFLSKGEVPLSRGEKFYEQNDKLLESLRLFQNAAEQVCDWWQSAMGVIEKNMEIEIYPISFGTLTSFYSCPNDSKIVIKICLRTDATQTNFVDALVSRLVILAVGRDMEKSPDTWLQRETIGDFILQYSKLKDLCDSNRYYNHQQMIERDEANSVTAFKISKKYVRELGFKSLAKIDLDWRKWKAIFSSHEYLLSKCLCENQGRVLTYDELAKAIYKDDWSEKFSLEYLAKVIAGIRRKLVKAGINQRLILVERGVGYGWFE